MRLKSEIFVSALIRRVFSAGDYAAVLRKGAADAGAIFIRQRFRLGVECLYGPAPQSLIDVDAMAGRIFELRVENAEPAVIDAALTRETRFDPDCWIVEIEVEDRGDLFEVTGAPA